MKQETLQYRSEDARALAAVPSLPELRFAEIPSLPNSGSKDPVCKLLRKWDHDIPFGQPVLQLVPAVIIDLIGERPVLPFRISPDNFFIKRSTEKYRP